MARWFGAGPSKGHMSRSRSRLQRAARVGSAVSATLAAGRANKVGLLAHPSRFHVGSFAVQIFYINRAIRTDRRAFMERQFSDLAVEPVRIEATEPGDITPNDLARYCDSSLEAPLSPQELSCAISHTRCWRTDDDWTLVLEDDAALSPRLTPFLEEFEASPPSNVDIVKLEVLRSGVAVRALPPAGTFAGVGVAVCRTYTPGSAAYLISGHAKRYLLPKPDLLSRPIDRTLFTVLAGPSRGLRMAQASPALAMQLGRVDTDIQEASRSDLYASRQSLTLKTDHHKSYGLRNALDHLWHLPLGISRRSVDYAGALPWVIKQRSDLQT